jgi:hypothetical protein
MFVVMVALAVIGFLIRYTLISGADRWEKFGRNVDMTFFGLDRHQWGTVHLVLGVLLAVLLILHIVFHWDQIVCLFRRLIPAKQPRDATYAGLMVLGAVLILIPVCFSPELGEPIRGQGEGFGRNFPETIMDSPQMTKDPEEMRATDQPVSTRKYQAGEIEPEQEKEEARVLDIRGYHTIGGLSRLYNVPSVEMKRQLNIPSTVGNNERLGRIRRIYGFTMREVEDCILALQIHESKVRN